MMLDRTPLATYRLILPNSEELIPLPLALGTAFSKAEPRKTAVQCESAGQSLQDR